MTTLAQIDADLRQPELTPLDRTILLARRKQVFERARTPQPDTGNEPPHSTPRSEGPEGED